MNELFTQNLTLSLAILGIAILLDVAYPRHSGILLKIHPVHTCYFMTLKLVKPYSSRSYGAALWLACILTHIAVPTAALYLLKLIGNPVPYVVAAAWFLKTSFSARLLIDVGLKVYSSAKAGDWGEARKWTQEIVRRDVSKLDQGHVMSAAIESVAESLVDGFTSPIFYYSAFGVLGAYLQRLINTLDGAVGFKTPELKDVGWFSAVADTVMNYVPARITALYIILSAAVLRLDWRRALKTYLRDRLRTESKNAGHPMSAMAGALGVKLEKIGHYIIGQRFRLPMPEDLVLAIKLALVTKILYLLTLVPALLTIRILIISYLNNLIL